MVSSNTFFKVNKEVSIPSSCLLAYWGYSHPYKPFFSVEHGKITHFFYHAAEKCFYYRTPDNKVRNTWMRARGMDSYLDKYFKYFIER